MTSGRARVRTAASASVSTPAAKYGARQPRYSPSVPLNVRASSMPPVAPLSSVPITAPRRSTGTSPAAIGDTTWAATVVVPTATLAASSTGRVGAQPAASSSTPVSPSRVVSSRRLGIRSPSGTIRKMPME